MRDVFAIARFECSYQLRSPLFLLVAGVFALLTFLGMASESVTIGGSDKALHLNSVFAIIQTHLVFSILGMFPAIAFVAGAIGRDYEMRTAEIFYATGVRSTAFVLGRFFGGTTFAVLTGFAALLGTCIGTFAPWLDPARVGPFVLAPYLFTAFVIILPNLFFVCAAFFSVAALTRSMAAAYGAAMVFIVAYLVSNSFLGQEDLWWSVYADPFGGTAVAEAFRYATVSERNSSLPGGAIYLNRVIWLSAGLLILVLTTWRYRFELSTRKHRKQKSAPGGIPSIAGQPHVNRNPSAWQQFLSQTRMDVRGTLRSAPFYVVLAMGMINVLGNIFGSTSLPYDTSAYPVTSNILRAIEGGFLFFVLIIVVYYAAELIHRERATRMADILDATPFAGGIVVVAKLVAVLLVIGVLLLTVMLTGITVQLMTGDTPIQPLVYLQGLFGFGGGTFLHLAVVAVFLAVATANRWLGMLCMVALVLGLDALPSAGFEHNLYLFGMPPVVHSDMNGFGHFTTPYLWYFLYWSLFCVLLVLASHLLFPRGYLAGWAERLAVARQRLTRPVLITGGIALAGFAATGIWIHHNTNVLNDYLVNDTIEARQADYEKRFKPHELDPVPTVEAIDARVAIDPQRREIASSGIMRMHNLSGAAINGFLITVNPQLTVDQLAVDGAR
ncbi:MAG: ABC transporter permease [Pseudomonadales bacterium]